jgi:TonB family protein
MQAINAQPILPLAAPVYPPVALKARAGMATVGVRITVDPTGRVENVQPSLALVTIPAAFAAEFQAAVEEAVKQWRFRPAEFRQLELVKDPGGDFQRVVKRENVAWAFDVEFTFNVTGDVLTRLPANQ